jgi:CheY-like chemotaxis protein
VTQAYLLLVEDRAQDELLIKRGLKKGGLKLDIRVAHDGLQAIDILFPATFDNAAPRPPLLILLDIKLPKLNGLEVLKRIRQHPDTCYAPVIMLSSSDDERDLRAAYQNGANSYLRKSVSAQRLNDALAALVTYWCGFHEQVGAE